MRVAAASSFALAFAATALAAPSLVERSVSALSASQLASFAPFTQFARAAYCPLEAVKSWKCGSACDALPGFQPTLAGGDGAGVQFFYVGFMPSQKSVVVVHQGTDPAKLEADLTDLKFPLENPDPKLFPGIPGYVQVHGGFRDEHAKTATQILAETKKLLAAKGANQVTVIGHSLGGALAELDSVFLALNLPSNIKIKVVTYGKPRVGNTPWAGLVDSKVQDFTRINNERDIVPIIPGRGLGFTHPHGEVHITAPGKAVACPGDDNADDSDCTIRTVPNILVGNVLNHLGPYEGLYMGSTFC
ncbi:alpha/beta-hydrolase [Daedaleopsis nitida]|nr:alpha/beta-hydrolase [Daedaleopsis nitida]